MKKITCINCRKGFKLEEGTLSPAITGIIQCPHCKVWIVIKGNKNND